MNLERKYRTLRRLSLIWSAAMIWQILFPAAAYALTSGPGQPEAQAFTPASTSEMVNPFTGDFSYNIPLFELPGPNGGYPFNLAYSSGGITMDQEATWVGLGWSLNPGAITREMRGLPDEFKGDEIEQFQDMKDDVTIGVSAGGNWKLWGIPDSKARILDSLAVTLGAELSLYYNTYKGLGFSLSPTLGLSAIGKTSLGVDLGFSLDSQDGLGLAPSISMVQGLKNGFFNWKLGGGYNSKRGATGLSLNAGLTKYKWSLVNLPGLAFMLHAKRTSGGGSTSFRFASDAFTPYSQMKMGGTSFSGSFRLGQGGAGIYKHYTLQGYTHTRFPIDRQQSVPAYGYMHLEKADENSLKDFNREKDGIIRKETPNLPVPVLTHDQYTVTGQGMGGSFRPWRRDVGVLTDRKVASPNGGIDAGLDLSGNASHLAGMFSGNVLISKSGGWSDEQELTGQINGYGFKEANNYSKAYEPWYFKWTGELSADPLNDLAYMQETQAVRVDLDRKNGLRTHFTATNRLADRSGMYVGQQTEPEHFDSTREARLNVVQSINAGELGDNGQEALPEFRVQTYPAAADSFSPNRANLNNLQRNLPEHHPAGMSVTGADGMRYVYAQPAKNRKRKEVQFSVDGDGFYCQPRIPFEWDNQNDRPDYKLKGSGKRADSDQYMFEQEVPEYAHAYLLTSVLGADYVDADDIPGPSDGDLGYWVKFNYVKGENAYKWRTPFMDANFNQGTLSQFSDDKASYLYGEKETWYLGSAETKTHIAEFHLSRRKDARGAARENQFSSEVGGSNSVWGGYSYKLDKISLYSKLERYPNGNINAQARPIKEVHLGYSYDLCPNVENNENYAGAGNTPHAEGGKLTLKSLWFTGEYSNRGALNKYQFDYGFNPVYHSHLQNRWGSFRDSLSGICRQLNYPYVNHYAGRSTLDQNAGAWALDEITLPSGGIMRIEYEADDYAYVQNLPAQSMFRLDSVVSKAGSASQIFNDGGSNDYNPANGQERRIVVQMDTPVNDATELEQVFKGLDKVYVKALMDMKRPDQNAQEYVESYLDFDDFGIVGSYPSSIVWIELSRPTYNQGKWADFHPLALAGWLHLRTQVPQIISSPPFQSSSIQSGNSVTAQKQRWKSLASVIPEVAKVFSNFYKRAHRLEWSSRLNLENSWVRLNRPDRIKVGGGCRVKKVTLSDKWYDFSNGDQDSLLTGVVYDYTMIEGGRQISSGVAAYEPMVGGDEIPLRQVKDFPAHTPLRSANRLFVETPLNESHMPAPVVGYRQVTVKSLATQEVLDANLSASVPTTGAAVHRFWTAKEFPVIREETEPQMEPFRMSYPVFPLGMIAYNDLTASQGYSVVLNDMHGKARSVHNYRISEDGDLSNEALSWVTYKYRSQPIAQGSTDEAQSLSSKVEVLQYDQDPSDSSQAWYEEKILGQDHEMYVDMRESFTNSSSVGIDMNVERLGALILPIPLPNINISRERFRSVVTNKIIYRSGILTGMEAWNEGSLIQTDHLAWDELTGEPLLTSVTNDYDDPVFSYNLPGRWTWDGMGPAFQNIGVNWSTSLTTTSDPQVYTLSGAFLTGLEDELLSPGDELLLKSHTSGNRSKAWYTEKSGSTFYLWTEATLNANETYDFKIVRSGNRNLLGAKSAQITALKDPTRNRDAVDCYRDLNEPLAGVDSLWSDTTLVRDTVPAACVYNLVDLLNLSSQSGSVSLTGFPWSSLDYCVACSEGIDNPGTPASETEFSFVGSENDCCTIGIYKANGTRFTNAEVQSVSHPEYVSALPFALPSGKNWSQIKVKVTTNSGVTSGYLLIDNSQACTLPLDYRSRELVDWHSVLTDSSRQHTLGSELFLIDSVLSAGANTFSDAWVQDFGDLRFAANAATQLSRLQGMNPWANGQRGIWRLQESYIYVDQRGQSDTLNTRKDGSFNDMPMYNFHSLSMDHCEPRWRKASTVTRYSPYSFGQEEKDILDIHGAAIYGYGGKLPIAVAQAARRDEIAFEGFEEYSANATVDQLGTGPGNWEIYNSWNASASNVTTGAYYDILWGKDQDIYLSESMATAMSNNDDFAVEARSEGAFFEHAQNFADGRKTTGGSTTSTPVQDTLRFQGKDSPYFKGRIWRPGTYRGYSGGSLAGLKFTDDVAHTGQMALSLEGRVVLPQNRIRLDSLKSYVIQAWVSRPQTSVPFYQQGNLDADKNIGIRMRYLDAGGNLLGQSALLAPAGSLVEGWQKIEGSFAIPSGCVKTELVLQSGEEGGMKTKAYFDDIRLQPATSAMECYVYDRGDYRLRATLDNENYALKYRYDAGGRLILTAKETLAGWRTLQENRSFLAE